MKFFFENAEIQSEKVSGAVNSSMGLIMSMTLPSGEKLYWYSGGHGYPSIKGFYTEGIRDIISDKEQSKFKVNSELRSKLRFEK